MTLLPISVARIPPGRMPKIPPIKFFPNRVCVAPKYAATGENRCPAVICKTRRGKNIVMLFNAYSKANSSPFYEAADAR